MMGLTWCNLIQGSKYLLTVDESQLKIYFSSPERVFMLKKKQKKKKKKKKKKKNSQKVLTHSNFHRLIL